MGLVTVSINANLVLFVTDFSMDSIICSELRTGKGKPVCILLHTEMGHGVDFMMGSHKWHGIAPNDEELANALSQNKETLGDY